MKFRALMYEDGYAIRSDKRYVIVRLVLFQGPREIREDWHMFPYDWTPDDITQILVDDYDLSNWSYQIAFAHYPTEVTGRKYQVHNDPLDFPPGS